MHILSSIKSKINTNAMSDKNETKDFLDDLANLSDDLKHPSVKPTEIEDIDIDNLLDEPEQETMDIEEQKQTALPVKVEPKELTTTEQPQPPAIAEKSSTEDIQNYVLSQCQEIIQQGKTTLEQLQDTVINTCDGKAINGYATLVASLSKVLDTANAIGMEKSRIKSAVDMENLKHQHKTQIKSAEPNVTKNTVNIVAGREEVMKMLENMKNESN